jgi:hypothetical protein
VMAGYNLRKKIPIKIARKKTKHEFQKNNG